MQGVGASISFNGANIYDAEIISMDPPVREHTSIDITPINDPSNTESMQSEQGQLYDPGEINMTIRFKNQGFLDRGTHAFVITFPGGLGTLSGSGFVTTDAGGSLAVNEDTQASLIIRVAGKLVYAS
jgi:hypothetical protein